jgi:hypothetical protein
MVTVFGLFVGPMLIPMLAGLLFRRVTWRGAAAGIATGFVTGLALYLYKTFVLSSRPGIDPNWLRYNFEAISILTNFSATILALLLTSALERVRPEEKAQIESFFQRLSTPVDTQKKDAPVATEVFSPFYIIAWVTAGTGLLLLIASAVQSGGLGRLVNIGAGLALFVLAFALARLHKGFMRRAGAEGPAPAKAVDRPEVEVTT